MPGAKSLRAARERQKLEAAADLLLNGNKLLSVTLTSTYSYDMSGQYSLCEENTNQTW